MTRRSVEVVERKRAASRGGDGALSFVVVCASPSVTPTLRVHRHRATQRLLSRCAPSFRGRRPRPFEFTRPPPGHGRGPRCVSSGTFRRPGGQAFYVSTLPTQLVLTRPPLDSFLSPCCALQKCGRSGQSTCFLARRRLASLLSRWVPSE